MGRDRNAGDEPVVGVKIVEGEELGPALIIGVKIVVDARRVAENGEGLKGIGGQIAPDRVAVIRHPDGLHVIRDGEGMGIAHADIIGPGHSEDRVAGHEPRKLVPDRCGQGEEVGRSPEFSVRAGADRDGVEDDACRRGLWKRWRQNRHRAA